MEDENIARIAGQLHDSQLLMTVDPSGTHELLDPLICGPDVAHEPVEPRMTFHRLTQGLRAAVTALPRQPCRQGV